MAKHKIHTIHHLGLAFFAHKEHSLHIETEFSHPDNSLVVFEGMIDEMSYEEALKVVEVHPNFEKYYEYAGMPLLKTYTFRGGTESPNLAIKTRRSKKERDADYQYVIIWKIFDE